MPGINAKLSDLQEASALSGGELIYVVQGGNSRQATIGTTGGQLLQDTGVTAVKTRLGLQNALLRGFLNDSPRYYAATGDSTTVDTGEYLAAEAANDVVFLPNDNVFNLNTTLPTKPVYGPGGLKLSGVEFSGNQLKVDVYRSTLSLTPLDYTDEVGSVSSGYNKTVIMGAGAVLQGIMNRAIFIGAGTSQECVSIDRAEGIGNGCMQFTRYAERHTAVGSANSQWLGASQATTAATHPWWIESGGFAPGDVGWDFNGMETRNPGIGADIAAYSTYAAATTDAGRSVAIGRDAIGGQVIATNDVGIGYRALAGFATDGNVAVGKDAFWQGVFVTQNVGIGLEAGRYWQEGTRNTLVGRGAADDVVTGNYNTLLGSFAGAADYNNLEDTVLLGYAAGNTITGTSLSNIFVLGNRNTPFLMTGDFATGGVGVGLAPANIKCAGVGIHIQGSSFGAVEAASGSLDDFILETSANTGMTIRSGATALGQIGFARPGQATRGVIGYDHSADQFNVSIAGSVRAQFGNGTIIGTGGTFQGAGTLNVIGNIYRAGTQVVTTRQTGWAAATGTATRTTFATSTVTTAQLAERVKAIIDDLITHGLIGA